MAQPDYATAAATVATERPRNNDAVVALDAETENAGPAATEEGAECRLKLKMKRRGWEPRQPLQTFLAPIIAQTI